MPGLARLLLSLACGSFMLVTSDAARAGAEWNPVRSPAVDIGPEASRLVVGFRATSANAVVKTLRVRRQVQSVTVSQAGTSDADIAGLVVQVGAGGIDGRGERALPFLLDDVFSVRRSELVDLA